MEQASERRVVITGLGVVAPNGVGKEAFWQATSRGACAIRPLQRFPAADLPMQVAGEITDFQAEELIGRKLANRTDRMTHFVFAAVEEALADAQLDITQEPSQSVGVVIANTVGGVSFAVEQITALNTRGPRAMSAYTAIAWLQVANVGQVALKYGMQGYCKTPVNDTAGGLNALGMAYGAIRRGAADVIVTGGSEAPLHPCVLLVLGRSDVFLRGDDTRGYRPFDSRARGLLLAEGAGICILEEYEHARRRGARIYGEIAGYGQTSDAQGWRSFDSSGKYYARALSLAMSEAGLEPQQLGYISLDGRASPFFDLAEAKALATVFGADLKQLPVTVPRTMIGHSLAAAGVIDTIAALLALRYHSIPPTINCAQLDPCYGLDLVQDEARPLSKAAALLCARSLGGANVVLALKTVEGFDHG